MWRMCATWATGSAVMMRGFRWLQRRRSCKAKPTCSFLCRALFLSIRDFPARTVPDGLITKSK